MSTEYVRAEFMMAVKQSCSLPSGNGDLEERQQSDSQEEWMAMIASAGGVGTERIIGGMIASAGSKKWYKKSTFLRILFLWRLDRMY